MLTAATFAPSLFSSLAESHALAPEWVPVHGSRVSTTVCLPLGSEGRELGCPERECTQSPPALPYAHRRAGRVSDPERTHSRAPLPTLLSPSSLTSTRHMRQFPAMLRRWW